jgi:acetyl esterase/lipase
MPDLTRRGWAVWNVEYRRIGLGGGYTETLADAAAAIDYLATLEDAGTDQVVAIGHSPGGYLAVWVAGRAKLPAGAAPTSQSPTPPRRRGRVSSRPLRNSQRKNQSMTPRARTTEGSARAASAG